MAAIAESRMTRTRPSSVWHCSKPRVTRPPEPEHREDRKAFKKAGPCRIAVHVAGDLGDREDEHEVEEQLERRYALFRLGGRLQQRRRAPPVDR